MSFQRLIHHLHKIPAHIRLWISLGVALIIFLLSQRTPPAIQFILVWSSFSFSILVLLWINFLTATAPEVKKIAQIQDSSRPVIFVFVLFASLVSLFAVILLLRTIPNPNQAGYRYHIGFSIISVILSWTLIHSIYAIRYTHLYYTRSKEKNQDHDYNGGLLFPTSEEPDYFDFAYFSFVIGMTFQVSDVQITSRLLRRMVLGHALISFAYNTVILALTINIIFALIQK